MFLNSNTSLSMYIFGNSRIHVITLYLGHICVYCASMLRCWHHVWILVRTDHPYLGVGCHNPSPLTEISSRDLQKEGGAQEMMKDALATEIRECQNSQEEDLHNFPCSFPFRAWMTILLVASVQNEGNAVWSVRHLPSQSSVSATCQFSVAPPLPCSPFGTRATRCGVSSWPPSVTPSF
jgi:hypothetical protein